MIDLPILNVLGWGGFFGLMIFYWLIGTGRPAVAYWASIFGASCFLAVGIASMLGYATSLPSLVLMESCCIILNIRALLKMRKASQ